MMEATRRSVDDEDFCQLLRSMTAQELKDTHDGAVEIAKAVQTRPADRTPTQVTLAMRHSVWLTVHKLPISKEVSHEEFVRRLALPTEGTQNGN
jgi:hypothetical protein